MYTAEHLSLAVLEVLVHAAARQYVPDDLVAIAVDVPDTVAIERVGVEALPRDWRRTPAPETLADLGARWVASAKTAVLAVPSVVVPVEHNYLLNPLHPDMARLRIGRPARFELDERLTGSQ